MKRLATHLTVLLLIAAAAGCEARTESSQTGSAQHGLTPAPAITPADMTRAQAAAFYLTIAAPSHTMAAALTALNAPSPTTLPAHTTVCAKTASAEVLFAHEMRTARWPKEVTLLATEFANSITQESTYYLKASQATSITQYNEAIAHIAQDTARSDGKKLQTALALRSG